MLACTCQEPHERKRIVLTGGPGAGKTAVLELVRRSFCEHMTVLPEAASVLFGGGFPRGSSDGERRAAQRAMFSVQRELEASADARQRVAIVLCDRGTVDGAAYWPGPGDLWSSLGMARAAELERYSAVIHLRTPAIEWGYNHQNPLRVEPAEEAAAIDRRIAEAWDGHPKRSFVESQADFLEKARRAIALLREEMPLCCREHLVAVSEESP